LFAFEVELANYGRQRLLSDFTERRQAADCDLPKEKPTGCLLGACSGQHPMGYRFSLLTLLFSGVFTLIKP
jgi:hypothetical protein